MEKQKRYHITRNKLLQHLKTHPNAKDFLKYPCSKCKRYFHCEKLLKKHRCIFENLDVFVCACRSILKNYDELKQHLGTYPYKCCLCEHKSDSLNRLAKHIRLHRKSEDYCCKHCGVKTKYKAELRRHLLREHQGTTQNINLGCQVGEKKAENISHQRSHDAKINTKINTGPYQCNICPRSCSTSHGLLYHLARHTEEKPHSCKICKKKFISKTNLTQHMKTHTGVREYKCPTCPGTFTQLNSYKYHLRVYPGPHWFPCSKCGRNFKSEEELEKHECIFEGSERFDCACNSVLRNYDELKQHLGSCPYKCCACDVKFRSVISMGRHIKNHRDTNGYSCQLCDFKSKTKTGLNTHSTIKHQGTTQNMDLVYQVGEEEAESIEENQFLCEICAETFILKSALENHQRSHDLMINTKINTGPHQCSICPRSCRTSHGLLYHLARHTEEKPHSCKICKKKFISKVNLTEHMMTHSDAREYKCPTCPGTFKRLRNYKNHLRLYPGPHSFPCSECGRNFKFEEELENHECIFEGSERFVCACNSVLRNYDELRQHLGRSPYKCCVCDMKSLSVTRMGKHIKNHTDTNGYSCQLCNFKSKTKKGLKIHSSNKHRSPKKIPNRNIRLVRRKS